MTFRFRTVSLCMVISAAASALGAQETKPLTIQAIFTDPGFTADAPKGMEWAPDGTRMTYLNGNGDLMAADGGTGKTSVLVAKEKIGSMHSKLQASRIWIIAAATTRPAICGRRIRSICFSIPTARSFLYSLKDGVGVAVAETGTASGDDPKFAPDGSAVTYIHNHDLYLRRLPYTQQTMRLTKSECAATLNGEVDWLYLEELDVRSNYFWSPDSKSVAYLQMNEAAVPQYPITDWIPTHATVEMQRYPQPGDHNPAVRVGVVNVKSGRTKWMDVPAGRRRGLYSALRLDQCAHALDRDADARPPASQAVFRGRGQGPRATGSGRERPEVLRRELRCHDQRTKHPVDKLARRAHADLSL